MTKLLHEDLSFEIIGAAMEVHRELGPGFTEQVYQAALERELFLRRVPFIAQKHIQVTYKGVSIADYYLDLVVDEKIDVELKALKELAAVHYAQVLAYLKASALPIGLLINFGETSLQHKRFVL